MNAVGVNLTEFTHVEVMTNVDDRRLAEFTDAEIAELLRKEGFGSLVASPTAGGLSESPRDSAECSRPEPAKSRVRSTGRRVLVAGGSSAAPRS